MMRGKAKVQVLVAHAISIVVLLLCLIIESPVMAQCIPTTANGFQENLLQATFHTVLYKTPNGYAASGQSTDVDGSDQPDIQEISNANGYVNIPATTELVWGTIGGHAQLIFLGDDNIFYAGGTEGAVLAPSVTTGFTYAPTSLLMPSGLDHSDVVKLQASNEVIMMVTSTSIYLSGNVCGNVAVPCPNSSWNLLSMPLGVSPEMVDLNSRTIFMYGSDGKFYTRGTRNFLGDGTNWFASTLDWTVMVDPPLAPGASPVQAEIGSFGDFQQVTYLVLDSDGLIHSLGNAPIVGNNSTSSSTWTKVGEGCADGVIQDAVFISASDNDNRNVGAGAILSNASIVLWGMDANDMLAGATETCPQAPCLANGADMSDIVYLENGTHLTPSISSDGKLCNVGHNSDGGFGDGTEEDRECYDCIELPTLPILCVNGDCGLNTDVSVTICDGEVYTEGTSSYTSTGVYIDVYETTAGCDSTVTTNLTVLTAQSVTNNVSICNGAAYTEGPSTYTETGVYTDVYTSSDGCDSTVVTELSVVPELMTVNEVAICEGEVYQEQGSSYSESGTYTDTYSTALGCDSVVTTILQVYPAEPTIVDANICQGETYYEGTSEYTETGTYTDEYTSTTGCDSTVTTILTVHPTYSTSISASICQGEAYEEYGGTYTDAGTYTESYSTAFACDSIIIIQLTVHPLSQTTNEVSICSGETYYEQNSAYTESGAYTDIYQSSNGCDSVVTTILTVNPVIQWTNEVDICEGESYTEQGSLYTESGTYSDVYASSLGCDSTVITELTVHPLPQVDLGTEVLEDCESLEATFVNQADNTSNLSYLWSTSNGMSSTDAEPTFLFDEEGTFFVTLDLLNSAGCASEISASQVVVVQPGPTAEFSADPWETDISDPQIVFQEEASADVVTYQWDFGDGVMGGGPTPNHTYSEIGTYPVTLHVTSDMGCEDEVTHSVLITPFYEVIIPNAFTPDPFGPSNGNYDVTSTQNHTFFPFTEDVDEFQMFIFNRWGEQLFVSNDIRIGWDGYFKGSLCPQDVYSYRVKVKYVDGVSVERLGTVTLFR